VLAESHPFYLPAGAEGLCDVHQKTLQAILSANGNLRLACERSGVTSNVLIEQLTEDFAALQLNIRTAMLVQTFGTFMLVQDVFKAVLEDLDPKDIAKTYTTLAAALAQLSEPAKQTQTLNLFDSILMALPPEQQEAFKALTAPTLEGSNEGIIDVDPDA
jgi:hypothetical protein